MTPVLATAVDSSQVTKGERTHQAILDVAVGQFAAVGLRGASMAAIAREVGVSSSAVYAHFNSKVELFEAAVDADVAGLIADALPEVLAGRFDRDFRGVFIRLMGNLDSHPLARRILDGHEGTGAERLVLLPAEVRVQRGIAKALRRGQLDGSVRLDIDPDLMAAGLEAVVISGPRSRDQTFHPLRSCADSQMLRDMRRRCIARGDRASGSVDSWRVRLPLHCEVVPASVPPLAT